MDTGYAAWMLASASLVLLMTPGLAFFYGGMTRSKSVLNMMMMSFGAIGVVGVVYVLWGWSMSFGTFDAEQDVATLFNNPFELFGLVDIDPNSYVFVGVPADLRGDHRGADQRCDRRPGEVLDLDGVPAVLGHAVATSRWRTWCGAASASSARSRTASRPSSSVSPTVPPRSPRSTTRAERSSTSTPVSAGLVLALILGIRKGFGKEPLRPHNVPFTMLGAGLLWFGWFGFNVGSIVPVATQGVAGEEADFFQNSVDFATNFVGETGLVWVNTFVATAAAMLGWLLVERIKHGKGTAPRRRVRCRRGSGRHHAGLWLAEPGRVDRSRSRGRHPVRLAVGLKYKFGLDDSLDVVGVHLVGGLVGTIGIGFFGTRDRPVLRSRLQAARRPDGGCPVRDPLVRRRHGDRRPRAQGHDGLARRRRR